MTTPARPDALIAALPLELQARIAVIETAAALSAPMLVTAHMNLRPSVRRDA